MACWNILLYFLILLQTATIVGAIKMQNRKVILTPHSLQCKYKKDGDKKAASKQ